MLDANIARVKEQLRRLLDFDARRQSRPPGGQRRLDRAGRLPGFSARHRQAFFCQSDDGQGKRAGAHGGPRDRASATPNSATCCCRPSIFITCARNCNCELQIGGSDQWGNITAGMDSTRKKTRRARLRPDPAAHHQQPTAPNSARPPPGPSGWTPRKTSVYRFYQFWIRTDDRDVVRYLNYFTFLSQDEIAALAAEHAAEPEGPRRAQGAGPGHDRSGSRRRRHRRGHARQRNPFWRRPGRHRRDAHSMKSSAKSPTQRNRKRQAGRRGSAAGGTAGPGRPLPLQRPGAQGHRRRRRLCQQYPRSQPPAPHHRRRLASSASTSCLRKGKRNYVVLTARPAN